MKKKIVSIFVCMLLFVTVASVTGTEIVDKNEMTSSMPTSTMANRAMWDLQFQYDVGGDTGSLYLVGVAFDGTYFYCPEFNSATIYRFDHDGNYVDSITIPGVPNLVDLTYDGTYVYGPSTTGTVLYEMDMNSQTLVSSIPLPSASYNVAYDADADGGNGGFWIGQWDAHLTLIDRSGSTLDTITPPESMLGLAWDPWTEISGYNGPFLWIFTGTSTGGQGVIKVIDLDTKTVVSGVEHNVALDLGMGIAGGLGFTTEWEEGFGTLYGMIQGAGPPDDYIFGYEICTTNSPPNTPSTPSGPTTGIVGTSYTYSSTTTDPEGDQVAYWFDWDDGTNSGWTSFVPSGDPGSATKQWTSPGTYQVTAKAKDTNGGESGFSTPLTVVISSGPVLDIGTVTGGLFRVSAPINNIGGDTATNVQWTIDLAGGAFIGGSSSGTEPSIAAAGSVTVQSGLIIGFGSTTVTVTATCTEGSSDTKSQTGFVFLIFIIVNPGGGI